MLILGCSRQLLTHLLKKIVFSVEPLYKGAKYLFHTKQNNITMIVIINRGCCKPVRVSKAPERIVRHKMAERTGDDIIFALATTFATHS